MPTVKILPPVYDGRRERSQMATTPVQELQTAIHRGAISAIAHLLTKSADAVNQPGALGWGALHHAAQGTSVEVALLLLERGADPEARTDICATPLHIAAFNGRLALCKLLLMHGAELHVQDATATV